MENRIDIAKATQIVQEYGLDANTVKVWNSRGAIPKKYLDGRAFRKEGKITQREMDRMVEVLSNEKINVKAFFANCETITVQDYHDYVKTGALIDRVQYLEVKKVLNKLRIEMKRLHDSRNFYEDFKKWINSNPEFRVKNTFDQKALYFRQGKVITIDEEKYRGDVAVLLLETSLI